MYTYIVLSDDTKIINHLEYYRLAKRSDGALESNVIYSVEAFEDELNRLCKNECTTTDNRGNKKVILTLPLLNGVKTILFKLCQPHNNPYNRCKQWDLRKLLKDCKYIAKFLYEHPNGKVTLIIHG